MHSRTAWIQTGYTKSGVVSDTDGYFEFEDLEADSYYIFARKNGYRNVRKKVKLDEGNVEEIEIKMKRKSSRIRTGR